MSGLKLSRTHSGWDVVLGGALVVLGLVILGNAAIATRVSVQFLGWMLVIGGVAGLVAALVNVHSGGGWSFALGGGVFLVAGLMCLRHVEAAALTLTLIVGSLFLLTGVVRLFAAAGSETGRAALLLSGAVSTVLGLIVLLNLVTASYALLGVLLGIQTVVEGAVIMLSGRVAVTTEPAGEPSLS